MSRAAEALDFLRQAGRVVCDADPHHGNDTDTLRRVMRLVESARVALAEEPASPTPPRSAEEIAREMVSEPVSVEIGSNTEWAVEIGCGDDRERVYFLTKDCSFYGADNLRAIIASAIERDRAARSQQPRDLAGRIRGLIDLHVTHWLEPKASLESDRSCRRRANGILSALEWLKGAHAAALSGDLREVRAIIVEAWR
ncbi:hypothetical protein [Sorangium sp. So ce1024]|uniref:hypothetical protein n=1 Tax=Sorangium sp. So ce1024 TaxID=3133327 RepID=UPI003F0F696F